MKKIALAFLGCVLLVCAVFPCFAMAQQSLGAASKEAILVSEDGQVLFEKLGLKSGKKNKSGKYSTSAEILEKLADLG